MYYFYPLNFPKVTELGGGRDRVGLLSICLKLQSPHCVQQYPAASPCTKGVRRAYPPHSLLRINAFHHDCSSQKHATV